VARKLSDCRWYSNEFKAMALLLWKINPGGMDDVCAQLRLPKSTLSGWRSGLHIDGITVGEIMDRNANNIEEMLQELRDLVASDMKEKILKGEARGTVKDYSMALGILTDKIRLINGEATSITESRKASAKESLKQKIRNMSVLDLAPEVVSPAQQQPD
jgi:hypothetical protein